MFYTGKTIAVVDHIAILLDFVTFAPTTLLSTKSQPILTDAIRNRIRNLPSDRYV